MAQDPLVEAKAALERSKRLNPVSLRKAASERWDESPGVTHPVPWGIRLKQAFGGAKQFHRDVELPDESGRPRKPSTLDEAVKGFRKLNELAAGQK